MLLFSADRNPLQLLYHCSALPAGPPPERDPPRPRRRKRRRRKAGGPKQGPKGARRPKGGKAAGAQGGQGGQGRKQGKAASNRLRGPLDPGLAAQQPQQLDPDDLPKRARWTIAVTACLLLLMCMLLVGVTLRMAPIIDEMGKQRKHATTFNF